MITEEIEKTVDELKEYADIEGTEIGEVCQLLIALAQYESYLNDDFYRALIVELIAQLMNFKENATIVEKEVVTKQIYKYIDWD